jgi:uncharacterized phiE125 gp8 family phage protein
MGYKLPLAFNRKTAPSALPVTLALALKQIKQRVGVDDDIVTQSIHAAAKWVENYTGRSLMTQTWQLSVPAFWYKLWLPRSVPLASITHVKYYDASNVLRTLDSGVYTLPAFHEPALIMLADTQVWPATYTREDAVQVEYVTGTADATTLPADVVKAILLLVGHWDANPQAVVTGTISTEVDIAARDLCADRFFWRYPEAA